MPNGQVAVWGSYAHGNFGDDLMAELFAKSISAWGYEAVVISPNKRVVAEGVAPVVSSLSEWNNGDTIVLGGGAMLASDTLLEFALRPATKAVEREFAELLAFCRDRRARAIPISIGGGAEPTANIRGSRKVFFRGEWAATGTVRLRGDVELMRAAFGKQYQWHPDVLFSTAKVYGLSRADTADGDRVGLNLHVKRARAAIADVESNLTRRVNLIPVTTHSSHFTTPYEWDNGAADAIRYESTGDYLADLATLDVIVSDKLHVGLVAATMGIPFISYQAKPKTVALHRELDVSEAVANTPAELSKLLQRILEGENVPTLASVIEQHNLAQRAERHLEFLKVELGRTADG